MRESETQRMIREEHERVQAEHRAVVADVVREHHPAKTPTRLLREAMKRTRGHANPVWVFQEIQELIDPHPPERSRT